MDIRVSSEEIGFYYLNSRYYDPQVRRFINADDPSVPSGEQSTVFGGLNLYAYCFNAPVMLADPSGYAVDTVVDIISLLFSIVEVIVNPADFTAWLGLAGDAVDLIPFLTGVGETVRALRTANKFADGADITIDTYRTLHKVYKGANLEVHHILEKRFVDYIFNVDISPAEINMLKNNLLSIPLTKSQHRIYTNKWRKLIAYNKNHAVSSIKAENILKAATDIYRDRPELLGAFIYSLAELVKYK